MRNAQSDNIGYPSLSYLLGLLALLIEKDKKK